MNNIFNSKIFVTGVSGCGKSILAKKLANILKIPYLEFDNGLWDYDRTGIKAITFKLNEHLFYNNLPNRFVIDAIPFPNSGQLLHYYEKYKKDILIVCLFNLNDIDWFKSILSKNYFKINNKEFYYNFFDMWIDFYEQIIELFNNNKLNVIYFDPYTEKEYTFIKFVEIINNKIKKFINIKNENIPLFKIYLDGLPYDKYYQDIECINFIGYSKSFETWERIKDLIDWKDKTVLDLGCFHGYFSLKVEKAGAKEVIGLDYSIQASDTARLIANFYNSKIEYKFWTGGDSTPKADVALVLNMLHHTKERETLKNINTEYAIFEINIPQKELILEYFTIINEINSARPGRIIIFAKRRELNEL